jgi:hypothetical protein
LPEEIGLYLGYCRSLKFEEKPDIGYLRKLFKDLFYRSGYEYDYVFDWMVKKPNAPEKIIKTDEDNKIENEGNGIPSTGNNLAT